MYKEVAIDPACLSDFSYYSLIKMEFGFEKGRYVSASVRDWAEEAYQYVKNSDMPMIKKKSVKNYLNNLKRAKKTEAFLLADYRKGVESDNWLEWWQAQSAIAKFSITLSEQPIPNAVSYESILEGVDSWQVKPSSLLGRNQNEIVDIIEPLLRISKRIVIIDQYFSFSANKTLLEIFKRLETYESLTKLHLFTSITSCNPISVYEREYKKFLPKNIVFKLTNIPQKYIHDRYVITDVGGLKAGHGFKEGTQQGTPADTLSINLMSIEEAQYINASIKKAYSDGRAVDVLAP